MALALFLRGKVDRRRRPFNRIPKKVLDRLFDWEAPALAKIVQLHPPESFPRVADVGGGHGRMARCLRDLGYRVTLIDPTYYLVNGTQARRVRARERRKKANKGIRVRRRRFLVRDAADFDLLVGMRPCSASQQLVRAAKQKPLIMLPCYGCARVWPGNSCTVANIEKFFRAMGVGFRREGREVFWTGESRRNVYVD